MHPGSSLSVNERAIDWARTIRIPIVRSGVAINEVSDMSLLGEITEHEGIGLGNPLDIGMRERQSGPREGLLLRFVEDDAVVDDLTPRSEGGGSRRGAEEEEARYFLSMNTGEFAGANGPLVGAGREDI